MLTLTHLLTVALTMFLWWFSTGAIMAVYGRSQRFIGWVFSLWTIGLIPAFIGLLLTRGRTDVLDVYLAVVCAVVIWGWQIAGYFFGLITGPRRQQITTVQHPVSLRDRFWLALSYSVHHELFAIGGAVVIALLTLGQPNPWAFWMYVIMWLMHTSAKLNVFLGVRNFSVEMLPQKMRYLDVVFGKQRHNLLFPFSITFAVSATIFLLYHTIAPDTEPAHSVGAVMIATMIGLGTLEHLLLMLPLSATLWGWGIRALPQRAEADPMAEGGAQ
jgi:putative photosynthetic complex assembly protein 2